MGNLKLAVVIESPSDDAEFLLEKQKRPAKFGDEDYDSFVDSDLWDLPSTDLPVLESGIRSGFDVSLAESCSEEVDLKDFDVESTLNRLLANLGFEFSDVGEWRFVRYVEEPEFGPDASVRTCFIAGKLLNADPSFQDNHKWMNMGACVDSLIDVKPGSDRVGLLVLLGLGDSSMKQRLSPSQPVQEYPPGVMIVPMRSRTLKPFKTTNLVVFAPENGSGDHHETDFVAYGDALIVDPGCHSKLHAELKKIVGALPRKLIVFVTHHHRDHIGGLSAIQESNPDAILVAHVKTRNRINSWSGNYTPVSGGENIYVNGQRLSVIFAPGHTDGHMALLHTSTHSLIVGDHCVGKGSAFLDIRSGGNMTEYFETTYKFLDLSPNVVIPMHGRVNVWPKNMLCGYLKNRRSREESILKATENGAQTLYDIVSNVYSGVDRSYWLAASSNVRLHIDNLAVQNKLPKGFSIKKFKASCGLCFLIRWIPGYIISRKPFKINKSGFITSLIAAGAGYFLLYVSKRKNKIEN
uniref:Beta-lactamase-like protein 2 n=1 Tax=Noccaea caerulescens TaxID=107243 RepID=A0A1J3CNB3_NOCCA